jgi:uncharacterized protein (DUF433 family)
MVKQELLQRITSDPEMYGGKPIIRGRRLAVAHVLQMLAAGDTPEIILGEFDWLEPDDIAACLLFAAQAVNKPVAVAEREAAAR